jgi:hypothetical protein
MAYICPPDQLQNFLVLCVKSGKLYWKHRDQEYFQTYRSFRSWNEKFAGKEAFTSVNSDGYRTGCLLWKSVKAHRIVWAMTRGEWPTDEIDHINGDPADNRPENLRHVSHTENVKNRAISSGTFTGQIGINKCSGSDKFRVRLAGQPFGVYDKLEDAIRVRDEKLAELGFHPNHGRTKRSAA